MFWISRLVQSFLTQSWRVEWKNSDANVSLCPLRRVCILSCTSRTVPQSIAATLRGKKTELHSFSIGLEILSIALGFGLATLRNKLVHGKRVPIRLAIGVGDALPPLCQIAPWGRCWSVSSGGEDPKPLPEPSINSQRVECQLICVPAFNSVLSILLALTVSFDL